MLLAVCDLCLRLLQFRDIRMYIKDRQTPWESLSICFPVRYEDLLLNKALALKLSDLIRLCCGAGCFSLYVLLVLLPKRNQGMEELRRSRL